MRFPLRDSDMILRANQLISGLKVVTQFTSYGLIPPDIRPHNFMFLRGTLEASQVVRIDLANTDVFSPDTLEPSGLNQQLTFYSEFCDHAKSCYKGIREWGKSDEDREGLSAEDGAMLAEVVRIYDATF